MPTEPGQAQQCAPQYDSDQQLDVDAQHVGAAGPAEQDVHACPPGLRCKTRSQDETAFSHPARRSKVEDTAAPLSPRLELLRDQLGQAFINWQDLEEEMIVGVGAFAVVTKSTYCPRRGKDMVVAVKQVKTELLGNSHQVAMFVREARMLAKLQHRYIAQFHGCGWSKRTELEESVHGGPPPSQQQLFYTQEFCEGGNMQQLVHKAMSHKSKTAVYSDRDALRWALQIALALEYLHTQTPKVLHRDLKMENILLTSRRPSKADVKLCDFGLARRLQAGSKQYQRREEGMARMASLGPDELDGPTKARAVELEAKLSEWMAKPVDVSADRSYHAMEMTAPAGSMGYMAPEVLLGKPYNERADVFSFGIILYNLFHRNIPTAHIMMNGSIKDLEIYAHKVAHGFRQQLDPELHPGVRTIIERCWDGTPQNRPRMSQLVGELQLLQEVLGEQLGGEQERSGACCTIM